MDPEQEFTYTMNCGGGSESSSSDSAVADADIDRADERQDYSEAEANAAGVDTSQDTSFDDASEKEIDAPDEIQDYTVSNTVSSGGGFDYEGEAYGTTPSSSYVDPAMQYASGVDDPSLDENMGMGGTVNDPSAMGYGTGTDDPSLYLDDVENRGPLSFLEAVKEGVAMQPKLAYLSPTALGFRSLYAAGNIMANDPRNNFGGSFSDNESETGGGSEPDNNAIIRQQMNQGIIPESSAARFYSQFTPGSTQGLLDSPITQDYAKVKSFISTTANTATPIGQLAVNESPFYDFLKTYNLDRGIL